MDGVLGLDKKALAPAIRDAYYRLARRYHPDRFRSGPLTEFLGLAESYFSRVTEAYNTLYSPELRRDYDRQLDERVHAPAEEKGTAHLARQNFLRAKELLERRRLAEAASYLENAIRQDESVAEYHLELGALLAGNPRRRADAEESLWRAIEIDPSLTRAYVALGNLYQKAARPADVSRATKPKSTRPAPSSASTIRNTAESTAQRRIRWPRGNARKAHTASTATSTRDKPLVSRWVNSMRVSTWAARGNTSPLQSGQWFPQPAPEPVARTYPPHRTTPML